MVATVMKSVFGLFMAVWILFLLVLISGALRFVRLRGLVAPLVSVRWDPMQGHFGMWPFVMGSLTVTVLALALAAPWTLALSVTGARVLRGRAQQGFVQGLTLFVAVPSVIYGWWGLDVIVPFMRKLTGTSGFSLLSAGMVLALMVLPTFSLLSLQALRQVPDAITEGSLSLGATEDQTLWRIALPASRQALAQAFLVALGRALGETIAVQMVIGGQSGFLSLVDPGGTLTTQLLTDLPLLPQGVAGHDALDFMALCLMAGMYVLVWFRHRTRRQ
jgi:phosphate transport system permease protein